MIEIVYKEQAKETKAQWKLSLPKNVRQIGEPEESRKIYIEDYVITYLKRFEKEQVLNSKVAVLLGHSEWMDGIPYLFIQSAIALKELDINGEGIPFTDEVWTKIYETMKEYFTGQDILGWFLSAPGYMLDFETQLAKTHVNYFGGLDKVLMVAEPLDSEEEFYAYENDRLTRQRGYYVYYERNEAMQRYMVETGDGESIDEKEAFEDRAIKSFRTIVQEKKELSGQKRIMTFLYMASTFLVMVVLVIGITLINNYEKMEGMELALSEISQSLEEQQVKEVYVQKPVDEKLAEAVEQENAEVENEDARQEGVVQEETDETKETVQAVSSEIRELPESYIVQKGDTLHGICRKIYGSDVQLEEICKLNGIDDSDHILAGQKLLLP